MTVRRTFSLVELLAVMSIIALLTALILGITSVARTKAAISKTRSLMEQFDIAVQQYRDDYGYFPGIGSLGTDREVNWDASDFEDPNGKPYLSVYHKGEFEDAWHQPFWYRMPGHANRNGAGSYDLWSIGRDGTDDTEDDITNWRR